MKILIICTGNSCRSQMAEAFLQSLDSRIYVRSGGTEPAKEVHPVAVRVMAEKGIDISRKKPQNVSIYLNENWDFVITVCDNAQEKCPYFLKKVAKRLHIGFEDPAKVSGPEAYVLSEFRRVRDLIEQKFLDFYEKIK